MPGARCILGSTIEDKVLHGLDLPYLHSRAGFDAIQHNLSRLISVVDTVIGADSAAIAVHNLEGYAGQRLILRSLDKLANNQRSRP